MRTEGTRVVKRLLDVAIDRTLSVVTTIKAQPYGEMTRRDIESLTRIEAALKGLQAARQEFAGV